MIKCNSCGKYGHYAVECRNKERDDEANLMFTDNEKPALMLIQKILNPLMLNEEKVMTNPSTYGKDLVEINLWYLDNGASNHMT